MKTLLRSPLGGAALISCALGLAGCPLLFTFDRAADVVTGSIRGQTLRSDVGAEDAVASFVRVNTVGAGRDRFSNSTGAFRVSGLSVGNWVLQLRDDRDGNGWPERTMTVTTRLVAWGPPLHVRYEDQDVVQTPLLEGTEADLPFVEGPREPIGIDLGGVRLAATFPVKGSVLVGDAQVAPADAGVHGRVYVVREACFAAGTEDDPPPPAVIDNASCPVDVANDADAVQLGAEAWAPVDANGDFAFPAVSSGTFTLVPMLFAEPALGDALQEPLAIGTPVTLDGAPPDEGVQFEVGVLAMPATAADAPILTDTRDVEIVISPDPRYLLTDEAVGAGGYLMQTLTDRDAPPCLSFVPDGALPGYVDTLVVPLSDPVRDGDRLSVRAGLRQGAFDLKVCIPSLGEGELRDVVVLPPDGRLFVLGPVLLVQPGDASVTDRDGDGLPGLPPLDGLSGGAYDDVRDLWQRCSACATADAYRVGDAPATCEIDLDNDGAPELVDCDDDGDGQPDVTEAPRCVIVQRGADYDADGLCGSEDAFPYCSFNTAELCLSDVEVSVVTGFSPPLLDPRCDPEIEVTLGERFCEAVGTGGGDCDCFSMICEPTYLSRAACLVDDDCDSGLCRFGRCFERQCDPAADTCGGQAVCVAPERVCLPSCEDDGDCANGSRCTNQSVPGAPFACTPDDLGGEGAPCVGGSQCQAGHSCVESCRLTELPGVEVPPACQPGGELDGLRFCQKDCSPGDPGGCRADQVCVEGLFGPAGQCFFPSIDITCRCRDGVTGNERPVRTRAVLEAESCTAAGVSDLWEQCAGFMDDPGAPGMFPFDPDPDPDPTPDGGVMDAGSNDDAGAPLDAGADPIDAGVDAADGGIVDAGDCAAAEICWNGLDDDCVGGADDLCPAPTADYPSASPFFEGRTGETTPVVVADVAPTFGPVAALALPGWATLDGASGTIEGTPPASSSGVINAAVEVTVGTYPTFQVPSDLVVFPPLHDYFTFDIASHGGTNVMTNVTGNTALTYGVSGPPAFGSGVVDQCAGLFDMVGYTGQTTPGPSFTVAFWFRTNNVTTNRALMDFAGDMTPGGWQINLGGGQVDYRYKLAGNPFPVSIPGLVSASTWTLVVVSHDATGQAALFLGTLTDAMGTAGTAGAGPVEPAFAGLTTLTVAASPDTFGALTPYQGELDELYIFEGAIGIDQAEIIRQRGVDGLNLGWQ